MSTGTLKSLFLTLAVMIGQSAYANSSSEIQTSVGELRTLFNSKMTYELNTKAYTPITMVKEAVADQRTLVSDGLFHHGDRCVSFCVQFVSHFGIEKRAEFPNASLNFAG